MKKMKKASEVIIIIVLGFVLWGEFVGALFVRRNLVNDNTAAPNKNLPNEISSNDDFGKQGEKDVGAENENEEQDKDSENDFEVEIINTDKQPDSEGEPDGIDKGTCGCVEKNGVNEDGEKDGEQQEEPDDDGGEGNPGQETSDEKDEAQNPGEDSEKPTGVKETVLGDSEEEDNNEGKKEMNKDEDVGIGVGIGVPQQGFTFSPLDSEN